MVSLCCYPNFPLYSDSLLDLLSLHNSSFTPLMVMMVLANQILVFSNEYTDLHRAIWTSSYNKNKGCVLKVKQKALG